MKQTVLYNATDCIGCRLVGDCGIRPLSLSENIRMAYLCCEKPHWWSRIWRSMKAIAAFLKGSHASSPKPYETAGLGGIDASDTSAEALAEAWSRFNRTV